MRQIHICAWFSLMSLAAAACGGDKFTASEQGASGTEDSASNAGMSSYDRAGSSASGSVPAGTSGTSSASGMPSAGGSLSLSAGGSASTGGSAAAGSGAAGEMADACASGAITFRMLPAPELSPDYLCDAGCGTGWLTITDPEGATAFSIFSACGTASCESCEMLPCASAACLPTPLDAEGSELVWNGTYMAKDTCGAGMACQRATCVKPGKYKAKACAAINGGASGNGAACTPKSEQLCSEVEFEFPATATVKLVLKKP